jgi:branched-chain amino acid transport system substrate-binding protein
MWRIWIVCLLCVGLVAAACSSGSSDAEGATESETEEAESAAEDGSTATSESEVPPIIIGAVTAESGLMAPIDAPAVAAAGEAIDTINAAGGVLGRPLELRIVDTESQFNGAFQAAESLINDDAALLLLTCDYDFALPAIQAGQEAGTLMISPCSGDTRWAGAGPSPLAFSMATLAEAEGAVLGRYALDSGALTAAVMTDLTSPETIGQCSGFTSAFTFGGGRIAYTLDFDFGLIDAFADDIPENEPDLTPLGSVDVIALCTAPPELGPAAIRLIRGLGYRAPLLSGSTMGGDTWIVDVPDLGDFWAVTYAMTSGGDPVPEVDALFASLLELDRSYVADGRPVTGADAVAAFAAAATATGSLDGIQLARAIEGFTEQPVLSGPISFGPNSHVSSGRSLRVAQEAEGRLVYLESRPAL